MGGYSGGGLNDQQVALLSAIYSQSLLISANLPINVLSAVHGPRLDFIAAADYPVSLGKGLQIRCPPPTSGDSASLLTILDANTNVALFSAIGTFVEVGTQWYAQFDIAAASTQSLLDSLIRKAVWSLAEVTTSTPPLTIGICAGNPCVIHSLSGS